MVNTLHHTSLVNFRGVQEAPLFVQDRNRLQLEGDESDEVSKVQEAFALLPEAAKIAGANTWKFKEAAVSDYIAGRLGDGEEGFSLGVARHHLGMQETAKLFRQFGLLSPAEWRDLVIDYRWIQTRTHVLPKAIRSEIESAVRLGTGVSDLVGQSQNLREPLDFDIEIECSRMHFGMRVALDSTKSELDLTTESRILVAATEARQAAEFLLWAAELRKKDLEKPPAPHDIVERGLRCFGDWKNFEGFEGALSDIYTSRLD